MSYPDDNYDNVHEQIIDTLREDYDVWVQRDKEIKESDKRKIIRGKIASLIKRANKIRP